MAPTATTEERFQYRKVCRMIAWFDIIDWGIDCLYLFIGIILVSIVVFKEAKSVAAENQLTSEEIWATLVLLGIILILGLGVFALRIIAAADLKTATTLPLAVDPRVAAEKCRFWRRIKFIALFFAILSLLGSSGVISILIDVLQLLYVIFSLAMVQRYIAELDGAGASLSSS